MPDLDSPNILNPTLINPLHPKIENYLHSLLRYKDNSVLVAMEQLAHQKKFPIVGRLVGIFLQSLAQSINAKRIFEFGSGYGYSAYWFAQALGVDGKVICTDGNPDNKVKAEDYLSQAKLWDKIDFRTGMAQEQFAQTEGDYDICYNDVDKGDYPEVWLMAKERVRPGGFYIADNVLWHGRVALDSFEDIVPGWTEAIKVHNALIFSDPDFDTYINPTRDGVIVARRKA